MPFKRQGPVPGKDGDPGSTLEACGFAKAYPTLWAFLAEPVYDDGLPRQTGTILVTVSEGRARVWLNDRDRGCSAWVSGETVQAALVAAEKGLALGKLEWRTSTPKGRGRA